eukprot:9844034-Alexandrium_andersonii.AAC.1
MCIRDRLRAWRAFTSPRERLWARTQRSILAGRTDIPKNTPDRRTIIDSDDEGDGRDQGTGSGSGSSGKGDGKSGDGKAKADDCNEDGASGGAVGKAVLVSSPAHVQLGRCMCNSARRRAEQEHAARAKPPVLAVAMGPSQ